MRTRRFLLSVGLSALFLAWVHLALADGRSPVSGAPLPVSEADVELARQYAPVLYFHPDELFRPQPVEVLVSQARLRQARSAWFDINVLNRLSVRDLFLYHGAGYFLDAWYGDAGASDSLNYSAHRAHYAASLSPEAGGPPITAYTRVIREQEGVVLQYWLFYYYNDWFNKHEGDWEMVEVILDPQERPLWVILSQHHGGTRRPWSGVQVEGETHPAVYVALGSHANYFWGDEVYPNVRNVGGESFVVVDRTGSVGGVMPEVQLLPEAEAVEAHPEAWPGMEWVLFDGNWGERAAQADFGGPRGPAYKGEQWNQPYDWGLKQPADEEVWYSHRLRVTASADRPIVVGLLKEDGAPVAETDQIGMPDGTQVTLLLHRAPAPEAVFQWFVMAPQGARVVLSTVFPYPEEEEINRVSYGEVTLAPGERLVGALCASCSAGLERTGSDGRVEPVDVAFRSERLPTVWDAPDVVWLAGLLPAGEVARGVGLGLLAGLVPTAVYVLTLYWADRYEKEPKRLLAATFLWGAIPALLVAFLVRVFFRLPASLLGPQAVEAVGAGLVAPVVEELLKGGAVLFVFLRYRQEFDDVLDGVVYGGMVGFGFAMTGNIVSYVGAFLLHGWAGLAAPVFFQGLLYALDHACYTAAFGAGLGLMRTMRAGRWPIGIGAFLLAVATHSLHNLLLRQALGLSPVAFLATWAGLLGMVGVAAWALVRQREVLRVELATEVPRDLYRQMTRPWGRARAQWQALGREGWDGLRRVRALHQTCAELAFKKRRARYHPEEPDLMADVGQLRAVLQSQAEQR